MNPRTILIAVTIIFIAALGYGYVSLSKPALSQPSTVTDTTAIDTTGSTGSPQADTSSTGTTGSDSTPSANSGRAGSGQTGSTQTSGYTMVQVKTHNSSSSCWATINGKVYDLTQWIHQHPGGPGSILSLCGTDGTAAFTAQHGGQGRRESELKSLYIGALVQ